MKDEYDLIIEPGRGIRHYGRDIWQYREFFFFLAWRDWLTAFIYFAPVPYFYNGNDKLFIDDFVNDSINTLPHPIPFLS